MKGRRGLNSFLLIAVVALACSCRAAGPELDFAPNPGVPEQAPLLLGALELPTPRNIVARDASHVCNDELRVAAEHLSWELMNYYAEMSEFIDGVDFTPHYTENGPVENAAVGIYDITINNYEPDEILRLLLPIHGSLDDAWIGLANFPENHYDWLQFPVSGEVPLTGDNFNFIAPGSHGFIMAVAFTGDELFALEEFYGGSASPVAELVLECAPETQCIAGETITFTVTTLDGVGMPVHEEGWDIRVPLGNTSIKLSGAPPPD